MLPAFSRVRVFVYSEPCDMRSGISRLTGLVRSGMNQDPLNGHCYCFLNRRRNQVKVLYWDRSGYCIWMKKLTKGTFTYLSGGQLNPAEFFALLEGARKEDLEQAEKKRYLC
jgi:transposase